MLSLMMPLHPMYCKHSRLHHEVERISSGHGQRLSTTEQIDVQHETMYSYRRRVHHLSIKR